MPPSRPLPATAPRSPPSTGHSRIVPSLTDSPAAGVRTSTMLVASPGFAAGGAGGGGAAVLAPFPSPAVGAPCCAASASPSGAPSASPSGSRCPLGAPAAGGPPPPAAPALPPPPPPGSSPAASTSITVPGAPPGGPPPSPSSLDPALPSAPPFLTP